MINIDVQKIDKEYVKDDCVQVMIEFKDGLSIQNTSTNETIFNFEKDKTGYINTYLEDERRANFPYGNIPVHRTIKNLKIYNVVNQILDFDTTYKVNYIFKGILEPYLPQGYIRIVKDNDEAFLLYGKKENELKMNAEEIKTLVTLGQLKIKKTNEPKIIRLLNRNIPKEEIESQKKAKKVKKKDNSNITKYLSNK